MYEIFMSPSSPFFKSAQPMEIGPFPKDEICSALAHVFLIEKGSSVESGALERAYDWVHGTTGDLQQICSTIWNLLPPGTRVTLDRVEQGVQKIIDTYRKMFISKYRELTQKQTTILEGVAIKDGKDLFSVEFQTLTGQPIGTIQAAIKRFENNQIIYQPVGESCYRFVDPFFQAYLIEEVVELTPLPTETDNT